MSATLIFGLGSPHGDDQLGWRVIELLAVTLGVEAAGNSLARISHQRVADFVRSPAVAGSSSQNSHQFC
ncbi:MAG TPA: hypothetical protein VFI31_29790, partial [Pirellulales bacterium]|nr:hypothetical protein [Pirellulales bacterium]